MGLMACPSYCFPTKLFPKIPLTVHTQKGAYRNFENSNLKNKIEICINMGPYGSGNFKNATPSLQF